MIRDHVKMQLHMSGTLTNASATISMFIYLCTYLFLFIYYLFIYLFIIYHVFVHIYVHSDIVCRHRFTAVARRLLGCSKYMNHRRWYDTFQCRQAWWQTRFKDVSWCFNGHKWARFLVFQVEGKHVSLPNPKEKFCGTGCQWASAWVKKMAKILGPLKRKRKQKLWLCRQEWPKSWLVAVMPPQSPQAGSAWNRIRPQHGEAALGLALQQSRTGWVEDDRGLLRSALIIICLTAIWTLQCLQSTWEWNLLHIHHPQDSYGPHLGMLEGMGMERKDLKRQVCPVAPLHVPLPNCPPWQEQRPSTKRQQKEFCEVWCFLVLKSAWAKDRRTTHVRSKYVQIISWLLCISSKLRTDERAQPLNTIDAYLNSPVSICIQHPRTVDWFPSWPGSARTMFTLLQDNVCVNGCNTVVITCPSPC
jgi:hypothetical protein